MHANEKMPRAAVEQRDQSRILRVSRLLVTICLVPTTIRCLTCSELSDILPGTHFRNVCESAFQAPESGTLIHHSLQRLLGSGIMQGGNAHPCLYFLSSNETPD